MKCSPDGVPSTATTSPTFLARCSRIEPDWFSSATGGPSDHSQTAARVSAPRTRRTAAGARPMFGSTSMTRSAMAWRSPQRSRQTRGGESGGSLPALGRPASALQSQNVRPQPVSPVVRFEVMLPADVKSSRQALPEVSPDGGYVAFVAGGSSGRTRGCGLFAARGRRTGADRNGKGRVRYVVAGQPIDLIHRTATSKQLTSPADRRRRSAPSQGRIASARGARPMSLSS